MSRRILKGWCIAPLLVLALAAPAEAGFDEGKRAAMAGDYATAYREWRPLAEAGQAEAQFLLGLMYREGRGVDQDLVVSTSWLRKAAVQGHVDAQYYLARAYRLGQGVDRDAKEALQWFYRAAAQHHADAAYTIALMYRKGEGTTADDEKAAEWYRIAARLGHGEARFTLASAYEEGRGVAKDPVRAYAWYSLAGKSGVELGIVLRDRLRRQLNKAEVAKAEALMAEFAASPPPDVPPFAAEVAAAPATAPPAPAPAQAEAEKPAAASALATVESKTAPAEAPAPPAAEAPAPPAAEAPKPMAKPGRYFVRLASYRYADEPLRGWQLLKRSNGDLLDSLSPVVKEIDLGADKGRFYRLYAGPLADRQAARSLCAALKSRQAECLVDQP